MTHRRGNGLLADNYVPLILLPPPQADLMLDALRRSGIAAYAIPLDDGARDGQGAPTDHLYVDAEERAAAEEILREELPEIGGSHAPETALDPDDPETATADLDHDTSVDPGPDRRTGTGTDTDAATTTGDGPASGGDPDTDDVWADLVARFYEDGDAPADPVWPDAENLSAHERDTATTDRDDPPGDDGGSAAVLDRPEGDPEPDPEAAGPGARVVRPAGAQESGDHYVPPPPPPLPRGDLISRLSWAGLLGGPLVLLGSMLFSVYLPGWVAFCAVAAFIGGFVVLVVRMGDRPSGDDGPDDGAVV